MFLVVVLVMGLVCTAHAKTYEPCELARELVSRGLTSQSQAGEWICLVQWESSYRTHIRGGPNSNGSWDYGLFQINDNYWCGAEGLSNDCGLNCDNLLDDNIADDVRCAKIIYNRHGFSAWNGWNSHCQGNTDHYVNGCF